MHQSPWTNVDIATTILFNNPATIVRNQTRIAADQVTELLSAVNAVRASALLSAVSFSENPASSGRIRAGQFSVLRSALDEARASIGLPAISHAYPPPALNGLVHVEDLTELRSGVQ